MTKRKAIQDFIEDAQTSDSYFIGTSEIHWIPGSQEFMLKLQDETHDYEGNGCGKLLELIPDEDIDAFYQELVDDEWIEDEETE